MGAHILQNVELNGLNSFGVSAKARYFVEIQEEAELLDLFRRHKGLISEEPLVLGGGSNILFTKDFSGLVIKMSIPGLSFEEVGDEVYVHAGGGVVWNDLVQFCVHHGFAGVENLALIPGTAGAAPVQNIGAYGVELMDIFHSCRAFDTQNGEIVTLFSSDCKFTYRDSIFKREAKGKYIITKITLKLSRQAALRLDYGAIREELENRGISNPQIQDVAEVVACIRTSKLPDPSTIGNAGSFFKNPLISNQLLLTLKDKFPEIVFYPQGEEQVKIAAGWLIEHCGWKGKQVGACGTWKNQALVIVNHGGASGTEIYQFSERIIQDVQNKFGIRLEREVVVR